MFLTDTNKSECDTWDKSFICPEGRCVPASGHDNVVCDHYADCLNGEDEEGCGMYDDLPYSKYSNVYGRKKAIQRNTLKY